MVLVLGLVLAACGSSSEDGTEPTRLLAAGGSLTVVGPLPEPTSENEPTPGVGRLDVPGVLARVVMRHGTAMDSRAALVGLDKTRLRFRVEVPERGALRVGLGYVPPEERTVEENGTPSIRHRVEVLPSDASGQAIESGSETEVILDEEVSASLDAGWRDREVSLESWAGEVIILDFVTELGAGAGPAAWSAPEIVSLAGTEVGWNLLLVSLDTLRADHLTVYGHQRPTSPHLDAFADRGVRFATAVAQAPWTRPSHRSFLTGLYPASRADLVSPLLAEILWSAGYRTTAITGGGQIDPRFGFHRGFDVYRVEDWVDEPSRVARALESHRERRQFLFLHTYRIHDPYVETEFTEGLPSGRIGDRFGKEEWRALDKELTRQEKAYVEALYDGGIAVTDRALGKLFARLEADGLLDRTIVVVTSDHGEQFWEHGSWRHGQNLYDHQLLVPLLVRLPPPLARKLGAQGRVVEDQVELIDLYPTLLELLEIALEHRVQGRSLVPLLAGRDLPPRDAFAENTNVRRYERKAFRTPRFKFIKSIPRRSARKRGVTEPIYEIYDLSRDPEEQNDISQRHPEMIRLLDQRLQLLRAGLSGLEEELPEDIDPDLREQLRALGYLGGGEEP
ncbi:MAG: sulfatase [Thermoanaerobaculia bacterium]|nr:sulfatase [Thermoanaerobaculia bacterium]